MRSASTSLKLSWKTYLCMPRSVERVFVLKLSMQDSSDILIAVFTIFFSSYSFIFSSSVSMRVLPLYIPISVIMIFPEFLGFSPFLVSWKVIVMSGCIDVPCVFPVSASMPLGQSMDIFVQFRLLKVSIALLYGSFTMPFRPMPSIASMARSYGFVFIVVMIGILRFFMMLRFVFVSSVLRAGFMRRMVTVAPYFLACLAKTRPSPALLPVPQKMIMFLFFRLCLLLMILAAFAPAFSMRIRAGMPKVSWACLSKFCICCIESMLCFMGAVVNILVGCVFFGYLGEGSAPAGIRTQVTGVRGLNDYRTTLQER